MALTGKNQGNKLAIAINSLDRPEYLKQCLSSLEKNKNLDKVDFYLYQDGGVNQQSCETYADVCTIKDCVDLFNKSKLPNKHVRQHKDNIGAGLQRLYIFKELFDKGYEYVVSVDNDLVFGKYYVNTLLTLFNMFKKDPSVGMLQTSLRDYTDFSLDSKKQVKKAESQIQYLFSRRWEQGIWKRSWKKIWPKLQFLYDELHKYDFKHLLHEPHMEGIRNRLFEKYASFHVDESIENCMIMAGLKGVSTRVPRHKGIGIHGLYTFNPKKWKYAGLDKVVLPKISDVKQFTVFRNKLCIAIRTLKRVDKMEVLFQGLRRNKPKNVDFYFYIDGAVNPFSGNRYAADIDSLRCLRAIQASSLPNKTINFKHENNQTAIQKYEMLSTLFPQYDYVMMLDNDLKLNKHYIKTIKTLFKQFEGDPKAGILHTSYISSREEFKENRHSEYHADKVQYGFSQRWEQGFWKKTWEDIKPYFEKYIDVVRDCDYKELISHAGHMVEKREELAKIVPEPNTDLVLEFCAYRLGYLGIHTESLRHRGNGPIGMYSYRDEEYWKERGLDKVKLPHDHGDADKYYFTHDLVYAEELRERFKDIDVYIAGSGPSLDTYPDNFFDDKTGVTLHLAALKFPNATYRGVCESPIIRYFLKSRPDILKKDAIFTNPFHPSDPPQWYFGNDFSLRKGLETIYVRYTQGDQYLLGTDHKQLIRDAIAGKPVLAGAYSTVLHSMLFAVLTMGAKRINLIGIDHAKDGDKTYYSLAQGVENTCEHKLRLPYRKDSWYRPEMCDRQRLGTDGFIDECTKHDIVIKQYKNYDDWRSEHEST